MMMIIIIMNGDKLQGFFLLSTFHCHWHNINKYMGSKRKNKKNSVFPLALWLFKGIETKKNGPN